MEVKIDKIVIKIGYKELVLSPEEAKELREILNANFGEKEKEYIYIPQPYPVYPLVNPWRHWEVRWDYYDVPHPNTTWYIENRTTTGG
jgi:hypothetical protein